MKDNTFIDTYKNNFLGHWAEMIEIKKPIIAAVNGYAVSHFFFFFSRFLGSNCFYCSLVVVAS